MSELNETVYEHLRGSSTFTVTAAERSAIAMVHRLKRTHPEEVEIVEVNQDGSIMARMPYSWMRIVPKRKVEMTEDQKAEAAERMRAARKEKKT